MSRTAGWQESLFDNMTITEDNLFGKLKYQGNE